MWTIHEIITYNRLAKADLRKPFGKTSYSQKEMMTYQDFISIGPTLYEFGTDAIALNNSTLVHGQKSSV